MPHGGDALGDDDDGGIECGERLSEAGVRGIVERGGAVVQNEHLGAAHQGARDGQALALPAREVLPLLRDFAVQPALGGDDVLRLRDAGGAHELFIRCIPPAPQQIGADGSLEQHRLLRHDAHALAQLLRGDGVHVPARKAHPAAAGGIEAGQEADERRLARARAAQNAHRLPAPRREGDAVQRGSAAAVIGKGDVLKGERGRILPFPLRCRDKHGRLPLHAEHRLDAPFAADRLGGGEDEVGKLDELHQNDGEITVERNHVPLQDVIRLHADAAHPHEGDGGDADERVRQRIGERGDAPRELLLAAQGGVAPDKFTLLVRLLAEGADDAHAREIFVRGEVDAVHPALHLPVEGDGGAHDAHDGRREKGRDGNKDERRCPVDDERHDGGAEHDDGRAQKKAQRHVDARLYLIDVARHAGDHGRRTHVVDLRIGEGLQLVKEALPQLRGRPHRCLGGKELRREGKRQPRHAERRQDEAARDDIAHVPRRNAHVHDHGDDERNQKLHARLAQLE